MDKDDLIFLLGTIIVLLAGIIIFSLTFTVPIKSGALQYLSGGAIIVSSVFLVAQLWKYLKKKIEESKDEKSYRAFLAETTTAIDYTFFHSKIVGKYFNSNIGRMDVASQNNIELKFNTILKAIDKYYRKSNSDFYCIELYTLKLLDSEQEAFYRKRISQLNGKIAISKDKSRYDIDYYDIHRIWIKIEYSAIKELFAILNENEIKEVRVIDEFNPNIFTNEDRIKALEFNFDFSLSVCRSTNECQIYLRRGIADNTTKFINEIFKLLSTKNSYENKTKIHQPKIILGQAKFFVVSDINGDFTNLLNVLKENKFSINNKNHILLVSGALLGYGEEIDKLQSFCLQLKHQNRLILISNDTDEGILETLNMIIDNNSAFNANISSSSNPLEENVWLETLNRNGELDIICNIMQCSLQDFWNDRENICSKLLKSPLITELIQQSYYYYEMEDYVFVHGWVPVDEATNKKNNSVKYVINPNWRNLPKKKWIEALNAYEDALRLNDDIEITVPVPNKTVICSHMYSFLKKLRFNCAKDSAPCYDEWKIDLCSSGYIKCIVFNQDKDNNVKIVNGKTNVGVFWLCGEEIIFDLETIDLDKNHSWNKNVNLHYSKDIKEIWQELSSIQFDGKYSNYDFDYFAHGQVYYDSKMHRSIIELQKFSQGNFFEVYRIDFPCEIRYKFKNEEIEFNEDEIRHIFKLTSATIEIEK